MFRSKSFSEPAHLCNELNGAFSEAQDGSCELESIVSLPQLNLALIIPQQVRLCLISPEDRPVKENRVFCCDMLQNGFFSPVPARSSKRLFFPPDIHCGNLMELPKVKLISWEPHYDFQELSTFSLQELNNYNSNFPISALVSTRLSTCECLLQVRHGSLHSSAHLSSPGGSGWHCVLLSLWI